MQLFQLFRAPGEGGTGGGEGAYLKGQHSKGGGVRVFLIKDTRLVNNALIHINTVCEHTQKLVVDPNRKSRSLPLRN